MSYDWELMDTLDGVSQYMGFEKNGDELALVNQQSDTSIQKILKSNFDKRNTPQNTVVGGLHEVADVPLILWYKWRKQWADKFADDWTWDTFLSIKLNDPAYSHLLTSNVKLDKLNPKSFGATRAVTKYVMD